MSSTAFTFEQAVQKIDQLGSTPIAVEALWDGDTEGWFILMNVVVNTENASTGNSEIKTHFLSYLSRGSDLRLFNGTVPPYPEAIDANEIGEQLAKHYNIEFFFPSPNEPDDDCPSWTERDQAIHCADCNKLIIPTTSPHLPKDICYNCHLRRETKKKIKNATIENQGVTQFKVKDNQFKKVGFSSTLDGFVIAKFMKQQTPTTDYKGMVDVRVDHASMQTIAAQLGKEIEQALEHYEAPQLNERQKELVRVIEVKYQQRSYALMEHFNEHHQLLITLINAFDDIKKTIEEEAEYHFRYKHGYSYRDNTFLRFVRFKNGGTATANEVVANFRDILDDTEVMKTLDGLLEARLLKYHEGTFSVTSLGEQILW